MLLVTRRQLRRNRAAIKVSCRLAPKVLVGERALAWIAAYRDGARSELVGLQDDGTLFLNALGNPLKPFHLTCLVRNYVVKSGIGKEGACHLFRHTMATLMLEKGADTRYIQAMLGHASLETTQILPFTNILSTVR